MKEIRMLSEIQDELYENLYPILVRLMKEQGYDRRSPNWWSGGGANISTHNLRAKAFELAITCSMKKDFEIGIIEYIEARK